MNFFLITSVVAGSVVVIIAVVLLARRRPHPNSNLSTDRLGPVSEQWLTAHRGER